MSRERWEGFALGCLGLAIVLVVALAVARSWPQLFLPAELSLAEHIDAVAQNNMAAAAWAMFAATAISAGLSGLSLWLIWLNLIEARKLARDGAVSAKAAEAAVLEAQRTTTETINMGMAQVRAYLEVTSVIAKVAGQTRFIEIALANSGQTPAKLVKVTYDARILDKNSTLESHVGSVFLPPIPAGDRYTVNESIPFHVDQATAVVLQDEGKATVQVEGEILYSDVFERRQRDPFNYRRLYPKGFTFAESLPLPRAPEPSS